MLVSSCEPWSVSMASFLKNQQSQASDKSTVQPLSTGRVRWQELSLTSKMISFTWINLLLLFILSPLSLSVLSITWASQEVICYPCEDLFHLDKTLKKLLSIGEWVREWTRKAKSMNMKFSFTLDHEASERVSERVMWTWLLSRWQWLQRGHNKQNNVLLTGAAGWMLLLFMDLNLLGIITSHYAFVPRGNFTSLLGRRKNIYHVERERKKEAEREMLPLPRVWVRKRERKSVKPSAWSSIWDTGDAVLFLFLSLSLSLLHRGYFKCSLAVVNDWFNKASPFLSRTCTYVLHPDAAVCMQMKHVIPQLTIQGHTSNYFMSRRKRETCCIKWTAWDIDANQLFVYIDSSATPF